MSGDKQDSVKTAGRTLDMFEIFARKKGPLSLSELAQQIGSPISSAHALVKTLRARGFVYVLEDRKLIYPTKRILAIAQLIAESDPVIEMALPTLEKLQRQSDETLILGKRQDDHIIYLEVLESTNSIRYSARPGDTKPLHSSSIGKAMLSLMSDAEITQLLSKAGHDKVTQNTISDLDLLLEDIRRGREMNVFVTRGENVADVMAIAVPVQLGSEALGIAIAGPMPRMIEKEQACLSYLNEARDSFASMNRASIFS